MKQRIVNILILITLTLLAPNILSAQNKFFSTPDRGGLDGAKSQAILQMLMNENAIRRDETAANAASITQDRAAAEVSITALKNATDASLTVIGDCGTQGMIFGPGHTLVDGNDCIPSLQVNNDGRVSFQAGITFGAYEVCNPATAGTMRYNASAKRMEFCNGDVWGMLGGNTGCSINFPTISDADLDTFYNTTDAVYSGSDATASVAGATAATVRRNGANTGMSSGVAISQGNSVGIRGRSASLFNQTATFTLDIGAYTACWQITTRQQDVTPNAFNFSNLSAQELDTLVSSNGVTISGFEGPLNVSVGGQGSPELKVDSGPWTSSAQIEPGQSVQLRMTTANAFATSYVASVSIGTYTTSWTVTTKQDMLYGGAHSPDDCTLAFGVVDNTTGVSVCRFNRGGANTACPTGWTHYQNWSETANQNSGGVACGTSNVGLAPNTSNCNTGGHAWGNIAQETCTFNYCTCHGCGCCNNRTAYAQVMISLCY
ncbi:MAG: hypothetical protein GC134_05510 [Proteobacteria bacterium]|nr:hypothetical protein [Pseudomonadota bacterium]